MTKAENKWRQLGLLTAILTDLFGYTGAGIALGYWLWTRWGAPWWTVLLLATLSLALAFYRVYQRSQREL